MKPQNKQLKLVTVDASIVTKKKRQYPLKQALKVLYNNGCIRLTDTGRQHCYKLIDKDVRPVRYLHMRTFKALINKQILVKQADGSYMLKDSLQNQSS